MPIFGSDFGCFSPTLIKVTDIMYKFGLVMLGMLGLLGALGAPAFAQPNQRPVVFAAASLKNALDDVNAAWLAATGKQATISYAASSALARQIEAGAPADIFISADLDWMSYLSERGLTRKDSEVHLLGNSLVLIAPAQSTAAVTIAPGFDLAGLLGEGRLAMANVDAVPAGKYGKAALESLGVWDSIKARVAQAENVRAALALVATGEAPLGIVYGTDVAADRSVRTLAIFPDNSHPPIIYPAALVATSTKTDAAAFLAFVRTREATQIFQSYNFEALAAPAKD